MLRVEFCQGLLNQPSHAALHSFPFPSPLTSPAHFPDPASQRFGGKTGALADQEEDEEGKCLVTY